MKNCSWKILIEDLKSVVQKPELILAFCTTLIIGIFAHGMVIFNKLSFNDDFMTRSSSGVTSGRWGGAVIDEILAALWGDSPSTPVFFGLIALVEIALGVVLIIDLFEVQRKVSIILIGGLMVVFPALTTIYAYNFMIHTYAFSIFAVILGTYLTCKYKGIVVLLAICINCFGISIYQAGIPIMLTVFLGYMLFEWNTSEKVSWQSFICRGLYYVVISFLSLAMYLLIEKSLLFMLGTELTEYNGINTMASDGVTAYLGRVLKAYEMFFVPIKVEAGSVYPLIVSKLYFIVIISICVGFGVILHKQWKNAAVKGVQCGILILMTPVAIEFIYVMCGIENTYIYSAMMYNLVAPFVVMVILLDKVNAGLHNIKACNIIRLVGSLLIGCVMLTYVKYDNMCYTKGLFLQEQAKSYFTVLHERITDVEGYNDEYPVVYINEFEKSEEDFPQIRGFNSIIIPPYAGDSIINLYSWREFMAFWCGYSPKRVEDISVFESNQIVIDMPSYPDAGSIKIIDDTVVVKF